MGYTYESYPLPLRANLPHALPSNKHRIMWLISTASLPGPRPRRESAQRLDCKCNCRSSLSLSSYKQWSVLYIVLGSHARWTEHSLGTSTIQFRYNTVRRLFIKYSEWDTPFTIHTGGIVKGCRERSTLSFLDKWLGERKCTALEDLVWKIVHIGYLVRAFSCEKVMPVANTTRKKVLRIILPGEGEETYSSNCSIRSTFSRDQMERDVLGLGGGHWLKKHCFNSSTAWVQCQVTAEVERIHHGWYVKRNNGERFAYFIKE